MITNLARAKDLNHVWVSLFLKTPREAGRAKLELRKCVINGTYITALQDLYVATGGNTAARVCTS